MFHVVNPGLILNLSRIEYVQDMRKVWIDSAWTSEQRLKGEVFQVSMMPSSAAPSPFGSWFFITEKEAEDLKAAMMAYNARLEAEK